jgi:hypothetical protein
MPSTPTMNETDPHNSVVIDPEVVLAARPDRAAATSGNDAARRAVDRPGYAAEPPAPSLDTTFRPTDVHGLRPAGGHSSVVTWAVRTGLAIAFAVCSAVAAAAWQTYGDQAQELVGRWMPRLALLAPAVDKSSPPAQPASSSAQATAAEDQTQPASAQGAGTDAGAPATAVAAATPDNAQLLQSMAHDLAAMGQQIADLKASIAQLKAGQDQLARDMARASEKAVERTAEAKPFDPKAIEQTLRPRPAVRPAATVAAAPPVHRPRPAYQPPVQPIAAAPTPAPIAPPSAPPPVSADPGVETVVRPPMPVR